MTVFAQLLVSGLLLGGLYALISIGLTLIFGVLRVVNFAHGELVMVGMYATYWLYKILGLDPYISIFIVAPGLFALGLLLEKVIIERTIGSPPVVQIFVTVGLGLVLTNGALVLWKADFLQVPTAYATASLHVGTVAVGLPHLVAFSVSLLISGVLFLFLKFTYLGKAIRATTQDRAAATLMGISIRTVYGLTFAIGTALVGVAAALLMPLYPVFPSVALYFNLIVFVVVVLGGLGSVPGALLGGLVIGVIETMSGYFIDPGWKQAVYFAMFILVLLIRPQGFFGQLGAEEL